MSLGNSGYLSGIPLHALRVFDAAARYRNMVRAAAELGLTQGAVSRHIKNLEDRLGAILFKRGPRGLTLTEEGDLLADYVGRALRELEVGLTRIGQPRQRTTLVVAVPRTFALRVLAPRIANFARQYPWIDLRIDTHRYFAEMDRSGADISVRAGDGSGWPDSTVERLTRDTIFPVCSPALLPTGKGEHSDAEFLRRQVIYHYAERPYWSTWLRAAGLDAAIGERGLSFSESALMLAAAESGEGVCMGRTSLVKDALARGTLVRPFAETVDDGISYFLVKSKSAADSTTVRAFFEWILTQLPT